jgi:hypothetical protein
VPPEEESQRPYPLRTENTPRKQRMAQDLCFELHRLGVAQVEAKYDGSGDSGTIGTITYFGHDEEEVDAKTFPAKHHPDPWTDPANVERTTSLDDLVDTVVCALLPGGWEINEGSFGTFTLDTLTGKGTLAHSWRVETTEDETFHFNM